jgi:hypothetical protein
VKLSGKSNLSHVRAPNDQRRPVFVVSDTLSGPKRARERIAWGREEKNATPDEIAGPSGRSHRLEL